MEPNVKGDELAALVQATIGKLEAELCEARKRIQDLELNGADTTAVSRTGTSLGSEQEHATGHSDESKLSLVSDQTVTRVKEENELLAEETLYLRVKVENLRSEVNILKGIKEEEDQDNSVKQEDRGTSWDVDSSEEVKKEEQCDGPALPEEVSSPRAPQEVRQHPSGSGTDHGHPQTLLVERIDALSEKVDRLHESHRNERRDSSTLVVASANNPAGKVPMVACPFPTPVTLNSEEKLRLALLGLQVEHKMVKEENARLHRELVAHNASASAAAAALEDRIRALNCTTVDLRKENAVLQNRCDELEEKYQEAQRLETVRRWQAAESLRKSLKAKNDKLIKASDGGHHHATLIEEFQRLGKMDKECWIDDFAPILEGLPASDARAFAPGTDVPVSRSTEEDVRVLENMLDKVGLSIERKNVFYLWGKGGFGRWRPDAKSPHFVAMAPICRYDSTTSGRWRTNTTSEFALDGGEEVELFREGDEGIYYAGRYRCHVTRPFIPEGVKGQFTPATSDFLADATMMARTPGSQPFRGVNRFRTSAQSGILDSPSEDYPPGSEQIKLSKETISLWYSTGILKVECCVLQRIGYDQNLLKYLQEGEICTALAPSLSMEGVLEKNSEVGESSLRVASEGEPGEDERPAKRARLEL